MSLTITEARESRWADVGLLLCSEGLLEVQDVADEQSTHISLKPRFVLFVWPCKHFSFMPSRFMSPQPCLAARMIPAFFTWQTNAQSLRIKKAINTKTYRSHLKKHAVSPFKSTIISPRVKSPFFCCRGMKGRAGFGGFKQTTKSCIVRQSLLPKDLSVVHP